MRTRAVAILAASALALTGCTGGAPQDPVDPESAQEAVVTMVDASAAALGGDWQIYSGPAVERCTKSDGGDGAAYAYILVRGPTVGDPKADVAVLDELWSGRGITTETYQSGGTSPHLGIRGDGGPTASIDLLADPRGYSISAVSECADGDASEMQGDGK
jgi:hypothetical protein